VLDVDDELVFDLPSSQMKMLPVVDVVHSHTNTRVLVLLTFGACSLTRLCLPWHRSGVSDQDLLPSGVSAREGCSNERTAGHVLVWRLEKMLPCGRSVVEAGIGVRTGELLAGLLATADSASPSLISIRSSEDASASASPPLASLPSSSETSGDGTPTGRALVGIELVVLVAAAGLGAGARLGIAGRLLGTGARVGFSCSTSASSSASASASSSSSSSSFSSSSSPLPSSSCRCSYSWRLRCTSANKNENDKCHAGQASGACVRVSGGQVPAGCCSSSPRASRDSQCSQSEWQCQRPLAARAACKDPAHAVDHRICTHPTRAHEHMVSRVIVSCQR